MNRITELLRQRDKKQRVPLLMTHVVLGYPTLARSIELVRAMIDGGASFVELQIPFSDPMADGPTIMEANEAALAQGLTVKDCFAAAEQLTSSSDVPILFMSYANIVMQYGTRNRGVEQFCRDAAGAGIAGLIVPDIPPEENGEGYWTHSHRNNVLPIPIVSPLSSNDRLKKIAAVAGDGFVYCVSTTGTTGARSALPTGLGPYLKRVKQTLKQPLAVGFGISTPDQVRALGAHADIAIVGSAMLNLINKTQPKQQQRAVRTFTEALCGG